MKVLITGAGGFIGKSLTRHLVDLNYSVKALVHKNTDISFYHVNLEWYVGDILDSVFLTSCVKDVDIVINLAARKSDESDSYEVNVSGTRNIIDACRVAQVKRIIQFSTISTKFSQKGPYAETKQKADDILKDCGIPTIIIKPSVVYGDVNQGIFSKILRLARLPVIPILGTGSFTMRPIHVEDVALAVSSVLRSTPIEKYTVFDLGGSELISFNDLIKEISRCVLRKRVFILRIPLFFGKMIIGFIGLFSTSSPVTKSNILAMNQNADIDVDSFNTTFNFQPRSLVSGLELLRENAEAQTTESRVLLSYIVNGDQVDVYQEGLYKKAITFYSLDSYPIPQFVLRRSWCIGALDAITRLLYPNGVFQRKLLIAAALMECSTASSNWLLPKKSTITKLVTQTVVVTCQSLGKIFIGIFILCIPTIYRSSI